MKIAFINGSPKPKSSTSRYLLKAAGERLGGNEDALWIHVVKGDALRDAAAISACEAIVIAFPLYVDSIPSHLLRYLETLEPLLRTAGSAAIVYVLVNCGFYEMEQTRTALDMIKIWCASSGLVWGQGIGIGGGGMVQASPAGKGFSRSLGPCLDALASYIREGHAADDTYLRVNLPRFLYQPLIHHYWYAQGRKNGLTKQDLYRKAVYRPE